MTSPATARSPGGWTRSGSRPVVFPVILAFSAVESANGDLPKAAWRQTQGGVHGEHDIVLHRPLTPGDSLDTWTRISAVRTVRDGTQVVLHIEQFDADGRIAVEQWWTEVLLKLHGMADLGSPPADHRFPEPVRGNSIRAASFHVDAYGIDADHSRSRRRAGA